MVVMVSAGKQVFAKLLLSQAAEAEEQGQD